MNTAAQRRPPGDLMIWVLIVLEVAVFAAGLLVFLAVRLTDPAGFAAGQDQLHRLSAGINTVVLVTSGLLAALALRRVRAGQGREGRWFLLAAAALGVLFVVLKGVEYAHAGTGSEAFFTFYYLLTGFHAAHVVAGVVILGLCAVTLNKDHVQAGAQFWHMVDLVWVILFPIIYLLR
ncbi:MAG: cytochrome c oxidase subunit 3 [Paracoccus sp. (in: a-proteobacteria)]|nr:cytochrome c oxidase subunit 3 [Paracoccus sp. (in: a-proteobacteria)]